MGDPMRHLSVKGLVRLKEMEGVEKRVYPDASGYDTIGVGHLLTKDERASGKITIGNHQVKYEEGLTDDEVYALLRQDLKHVEWAVESGVKVELTQDQFDCLICFVFNIGVSAFLNSTLRRKLNNGQYAEVPMELRRWVYSAGKKFPGLERRREKEIELWERG